MIRRPLHFLLLTLCIAAGLSNPSLAAGVVPGGSIWAFEPDPVRPDRLYLVTDVPEFVVIDTSSASVIARVPLPRLPGFGIAIDPDGSRAWVALTAPPALLAIDLSSHVSCSSIPLTGTGDVEDVVAGRPGRLYASLEDRSLVIVDSDAGVELLRRGGLGGPWTRMVMRSDKQVLYLRASTAVGGVVAHDVTDDSFVQVGQRCSVACPTASTIQLALSPDQRLLYETVGGPGSVRVANADTLFHEERRLPVGDGPNGIAPSLDGSRLYITRKDPDLVAAIDLATGLFVQEVGLPEPPTGFGLRMAVDGSWLATLREENGAPLRAVEIVRPAEFEDTTMGFVSVRPLDSVTLEPIQAWLSLNIPTMGDVGMRSVADGIVSWGPAPAGDYELELHTDSEAGVILYEQVNLVVTVRAGEWTDLGDVVVPRVFASHARPSDIRVMPALVPGERMDVQVLGRNFVDGPGLSLNMGPEVVVHSFAWESWSKISATVTADASHPPGFRQQVSVGNPDGIGYFGLYAVGDWPARDPSDLLPPSPVDLIWVRKRPDRMPGYLFEWTAVDTQVDGSPETVVDYLLRLGTGPQNADASDWLGSPDLSVTWSPAAPGDELPPFSTFTVFARDAEGNVADATGCLP